MNTKSDEELRDTYRHKYLVALDMLIKITGTAHNAVTSDEVEDLDDLNYKLIEVTKEAKDLIKELTGQVYYHE